MYLMRVFLELLMVSWLERLHIQFMISLRRSVLLYRHTKGLEHCAAHDPWKSYSRT